jgi:Lipid A 3-O-deacylase (PagL)
MTGARRVSIVWMGLTALAIALGTPGVAPAFDPDAEFAKGTVIAGFQLGGGAQNNIAGDAPITGISYLNFTPRLSYLPFAPFGSGAWKGALEPGVEGWVQYYLHPDKSWTAEGLKAAVRYHFIGLGPVVPYLEVTGGVGATNLDVNEIRSDFTFVIEGGAGVSYFVAPSWSVNLGYRFQHLSNGGFGHPNRGVNSNGGVLGLSYHFR